jgi:formylglycine-generating enzyme required for sulfatase activity
MLVACQPSVLQTPKPVLRCLASDLAPITLPGGKATIGSDTAYVEEAPARTLSVASFSIDATEVTNAQFSRFIEATGYVTLAEKAPDLALIPPNAPPYLSLPGSAVFKTATPGKPYWWSYVPGANWRHPEGPKSTIDGRTHFPVVQIAYADARAYAQWVGRRLPSEVEWEYAAKAGAATLYPWGDERVPDGQHRANTWQGLFPVDDRAEDGFGGLAPVGCFAPNAFGLYDMIGNAWEWTSTPYAQSERQSSSIEPVYTIKGGSYLCADNYCRRYRASARQPQEAGLGSNHIGFRTIGVP